MALLLALAQDRFVTWGLGPQATEKIALRVRTILPITSERIDDGVILIAGGKIEAVGRIAIPDGYRLIEIDGVAVPGFVDLHVHIAGGDINDAAVKSNPELRTLDVIAPENPDLRRTLAGGVTTALFLPGSATSLGGLGTLIKTHGATAEEMLIRFPGALKIAQGNNPLGVPYVGNTHMGNNWIIRDALREGKSYHEAWERHERGDGPAPERLARLDALRGLFAREFPAAVHTQYFEVTQATYRILVDELGLWTVFDHSTFDAFKNWEAVKARGIPTICGPRMLWMDRETGQIHGIAAAWEERGVTNLGLNTDSPVVPGEELQTQAAVAMQLGLSWTRALEGVTIAPARAVGIEHRVGSLEPGKDADIVVWSGDPLDVRSYVHLAIVNGRIAYDPGVEGRRF